MPEETHKKTGFILSTISGLASIALTFGLRFLYPNLSSGLGDSFVILQIFTLVGGILILIGVAVALLNIQLGKIIILISGIIAGGNVLAIVGAVLLTKKVTKTKSIYKNTFPYICDSCREFSYTFAEYCENCGTKGSIREATSSDYEELSTKQ